MVKMDCSTSLPRRRFTKRLFATAAFLALPAPVLAVARRARHQHLSFYHTHTCQELEFDLHPDGCDPRTLARVNRFLRDFRTGEVHPIDPKLLDILCLLQEKAQFKGVYQIISGYRSPATNAKLRQTHTGVAKKSLHMKGQAVDIRLVGYPTSKLRDHAISLRRGGVGYYAKSDFVHIDTGKVRSW